MISDASVSDLAAAAALINKRLAAGGLQPRIASTMTRADTAEAHRLVEEGTVRGRIDSSHESDSGMSWRE